MTTETISLPPPKANAPLLTRMMSDPLLGGEQPIPWVVGAQHPLAPEGWQIRRMFIELDGVEVYAVSPDGKHGTRTSIPIARVRLIEEAMSRDVFIDQLEAAETGDDDDDDLEPEPEEPSAPSPNGQPVT